MTLHIVIGPPAAGKSTYIREHRQPGDITIDYDELANTLAGLAPANHEHTATVKKITRAARDAAIREAQKHATDTDVWIIHSTPAQSTIDRYRREGAQIHVVDPGKDTVMHRIKHERPGHMHAVAARWYQQQDDAKRPKTTTERGYGHTHQIDRRRLLTNHTDGTPCDWCGQPMYREPKQNFDNAPLEADHAESLKLHGPSRANRLRHRRCNRQAREGGATREHLRPTRKASTPDPRGGQNGWDWLG
ncbi:AAA family ATPase [Corynebacterium variabile]|uniref:AAA family ATPase n=1 Tax=Corynebacterium variabile TaxID=1727 RepID=UPI00289DC610|nr:AAA family ATPase [Corynebacterium variabile]